MPRSRFLTFISLTEGLILAIRHPVKGLLKMCSRTSSLHFYRGTICLEYAWTIRFEVQQFEKKSFGIVQKLCYNALPGSCRNVLTKSGTGGAGL